MARQPLIDKRIAQKPARKPMQGDPIITKKEGIYLNPFSAMKVTSSLAPNSSPRPQARPDNGLNSSPRPKDRLLTSSPRPKARPKKK